jgi:uroporphyrin-3 C-methyltransferase
MKKRDSTSDRADGAEVSTTDTDAVQVAGADSDTAASSDTEAKSEPIAGSVSEAEPASQPVAESIPEAEPASEPVSESVPEAESASEPASGSVSEPGSKSVSKPEASPKPRRSWLSLFNFLLILGLAAGAGYYWWQQQQVARDYTAAIAELEQQLASKVASSGLDARLDASLSPLKGDIDSLGRKIDEFGLEQQELRASSEKLYELFGRDKSDWQLAEVEYLMRVAQHKLILQDDFEGAAITLQAASDKIGLTGDPGLLSVRVMISEEIADLKTRKRADLVGMTLILAQLGRQVRVLKPGFAIRVDETPSTPAQAEITQVNTARDWFDRLIAFIDSLVEVRNEAIEPSEIEANIADVGASLEDNLKLARWAVLERDATQYQLLLEQSIRLFGEYYDLDNAANHDFMTQLRDLQKMVLKPEKPDITGSLYELRRILSQRENAPAEAPEPAAIEITEPDNG